MKFGEKWPPILALIFYLGAGILLGFCVIAWLQTPPANVKQLRPLIREINDYKTVHGRYPTSCAQFTSFSKLTNEFRIYDVYSEPAGKGSALLADRISGWEIIENDFTILLMPDGYKIFIPIADTKKTYAMRFDFSVWRYDSTQGNWRKGKIINTSFGPFWKSGFLR